MPLVPHLPSNDRTRDDDGAPNLDEVVDRILNGVDCLSVTSSDR